jgi:hypothetical protein
MDDPIAIFERVISKQVLGAELERGCFAMVRPLRHPLGFFAFMGPAHQGVALRMHYWPRYAEVLQSGFEIHDHQYDIESRVISGALEQTIFELAVGEPVSHSVYLVHYDGLKSGLRKTAKHVGLFASRIQESQEGASYKLASGILHRAHPPLGSETVTLVLARGANGGAQVLGPVDGPDHIGFQRESIGDEESAALRRDVLNLLRRP